MSVTRRAVLRTGAASLVILGAGGLWATRQTATGAREPWRAVGETLGDPRLDALAYAILAPNPHNMQPWQVRLDGESAFRVFADPARLLPETDPSARQITIGFGCFLELFRQAAAEKGFRCRVEAFPDGESQLTLDSRPVARVTLSADPTMQRDVLFGSVLSRHTQRQPFDTTRGVSAETLNRVLSTATPDIAVAGTVDPAQRDALRELTAQAWTSEWENTAARGETVRVTRIGRTEVANRPWGITLDGAFIGTLGAVGLLSRDAMHRPGTTAYEQGMKGYLDACSTAMGYLWGTTAGNTRRDQLNTGASWVRLHQAAAGEGLAFHPLSQALQEFPAMAPHYRRAHTLLAPVGHTVQMLVRLGYAPAAGPSPREPLSAKLLAG